MSPTLALLLIFLVVWLIHGIPIGPPPKDDQ